MKEQKENTPIIIARKQMTARIMCPNCNRNTIVNVREVKGECRSCKKEISGIIIVEDDCLSTYAWAILRRAETENTIALQVRDSYLSNVERLISIFTKVGFEVKKRERISIRDKYDKDGTNVQIWQITIEKIGAIS